MRYEAAQHDPTGRMLDGCAAPKTLLLKEGAQVVLLKNLDPIKKLVNGSCGVVVGFRAARVRAEAIGIAPTRRAARSSSLPNLCAHFRGSHIHTVPDGPPPVPAAHRPCPHSD